MKNKLNPSCKEVIDKMAKPETEQAENTEEQAEKVEPVYQAREGLVSASLFEREQAGTKGNFTSQSVALNISFVRDGDFEQRNITIIKNNLDKVIRVLQDIKEHMN